MRRIIVNQKQILFFVLVGAFSALIELVLMKFFTHMVPKFYPREVDFFGIKYPFSNILSTGCAILVNYWLSIKFVFIRGKYGMKREFTYFVLFSLITMVLSLTVFQIFINFIILKPFNLKIFTINPVILSKMMAIGIVSILNYVIKKKVIFNG